MTTQTQTPATNRRRHERFRLQPMYTTVAVCPLDRPDQVHEGHAYEISEGGLRFELDDPMPLGHEVVVRVTLPALGGEPAAERTVFARAAVLRLVEDDGPGPARMAASFTRFIRPADRERLLGYFSRASLARAA